VLGADENGGMDIEAVIFDCDGTLVDSEPLALAALLHEAARLGVDGSIEVELATMQGQSMRRCIEAIQRRATGPLPSDFEARVRATMAGLFSDRLEAIPGAVEVTADLQLPACVATNGPREKAELTLGLTGLLPRFDGLIVSAYEVGAWKPDPALVLRAAALLSASPRNCVLVEDSDAGIAAGLAAGMTVYALRGANELPGELSGRGVRHLASLASLQAEPWWRGRR
jgi:HAD superfamily hydrolase (TIGR01509 family)